MTGETENLSDSSEETWTNQKGGQFSCSLRPMI